MRSVGIRELKAETSQVLRRVREEGETIQITYRGRPVALLLPLRTPFSRSKEASTVDAVRPDDWVTFWTNLDRVTAAIGAEWPEGVSAVDAVKEGRREL